MIKLNKKKILGACLFQKRICFVTHASATDGYHLEEKEGKMDRSSDH